MMKKIDFAFVVLVYRDYLDLDDLCSSIKEHVNNSYRVIVVDAFYDLETSENVRSTAQKLNCDYFQIDNKGYGFGNNRGIEYACKNYDFDWIVICNPDTVLKSDLTIDNTLSNTGIIAPDIIAKSGKHQNPYWAYENKLSEWLIFCGYRKKSKMLTFLGVGINKVFRDIFRLMNWVSHRRINKIYACHGSFVIINKNFIKDFFYDEKMFLFYEEACLAISAKYKNISTVYSNKIVVFHKEDGSMSIAETIEYPHLRNSYMHYYKKYRINKYGKN